MIRGIIIVILLGVAVWIFQPSAKNTEDVSASGSVAQGVSIPENMAQALKSVNLTFTSDPVGAEVFFGTVSKGVTPLTVSVAQDIDTEYTVKAKEPNELYDLYKPFTGTFNISQDETISVC